MTAVLVASCLGYGVLAFLTVQWAFLPLLERERRYVGRRRGPERGRHAQT